MTEAEYNEILKRVMDIRINSWPEDRPDVPQTLPVGPALGQEIYLPLEGRKIRILFHKPESGKESYPVYFNFHGGGMAAGTPEQDEFMCRQISEETDCVVVNVEYRLAPEHPFPEGLYDAYDSVLYMLAHSREYGIDPKRAALGGQSAGGNLAVSVSILANRAKSFTYRGVAICYAGLKFFEEDNHVKGAVVKSTSRLYNTSYAAGGGDMHNPLASPILASDEDIRDTPSILIMSASLDALRTDSERYAKKLADVGVPVIYKCFMNCVHGFTHRGYKEEPQQAIHLIERYLENIWKE